MYFYIISFILLLLFNHNYTYAFCIKKEQRDDALGFKGRNQFDKNDENGKLNSNVLNSVLHDY